MKSDANAALAKPCKPHGETHFVTRIGWLRAAVLGANDGLLSTSSLMGGVAAAAVGDEHRPDIPHTDMDPKTSLCCHSLVPKACLSIIGARSNDPFEALARLKEGNCAFLNDEPLQPLLDRASRLALAGGQKPVAAYVSCSDSPVPPELLFGRGLGELFIVRNAGNTLDVAAMGSLEFAVGVLDVPLIVVMGHEGCGAVSAAVSVVTEGARFPGNIGKMVEPVIPAVLEAARRGDTTLEAAVRQNVVHAVRELREDSAPALIEAQASGRLLVAETYYALSSGKVDFFDTEAGSAATKT